MRQENVVIFKVIFVCMPSYMTSLLFNKDSTQYKNSTKLDVMFICTIVYVR